MSGIKNWQQRTELLIGKKKLKKFNVSHVLVAGLGGVGACAAEMLCRAGIGNMTLIDADVFQTTNLNRQIPSLQSNIGKKKTGVLKRRLKDINPKVNIEIIDRFLTRENIPTLFTKNYDYIIDAIDTLTPKIYLIYNTIKNNIPLVSSMGSGGRINPSLVKIADISESHTCNLARILRKRLHKLGIYDGFKVVFSSERVNPDTVELTEKEKNKKTNIGTISYMPVVFGCFCASTVINDLTS